MGLSELYSKWKPEKSIKLTYELIDYFVEQNKKKQISKYIKALYKAIKKLKKLKIIEMENFGLYLLNNKDITQKIKKEKIVDIVKFAMDNRYTV